jgi:hypothetical protein
MKKCARCQETKSESEFGFKTKGRLQPYCRPCNAANNREYYAKNKEHHKKKIRIRNKRYLEETRKRIRSLKEATPCADCGERYPWYVMDFDHVRGDKVSDISKMVATSVAKSKLEEEIAKCELVCSNCHRVRTFTRSGHVVNEDS